MAYSLLGINDPRLYMAGDGLGTGLQQFAGNWAANTNAGIKAGIGLGTDLTRYGAQQRLAGSLERNAQQNLNTQLVTAQNGMLQGITAQQKYACDLIGWASPACQALKARALEMDKVRTAQEALGFTPAPGSLDIGALMESAPVDPVGNIFDQGTVFGGDY